MDWEEHYQLWREARQRWGDEAYHQLQLARKRVAQNSREDWQWLISSLEDNERKWLVAEVFRFQQLPKRMFLPMLRAGVLERNPSTNSKFIKPCVRCYGGRRVCTVLLTYLETGSNVEKAGAASALYWALTESHWLKPDEDMSEIKGRMDADMLQEFVNNEDVRVRQRIIRWLRLSIPSTYPEELQPLVLRAIEIARSHPDEYIRHGMDTQRGGSVLFMAMPDDE